MKTTSSIRTVAFLGDYLPRKCGIATFTFGVASAIAAMDHGKMSVTGIVMGLHVMLLFYWALFAYLFSLEILETLMTVAIVMLIQSAAVCGIWKA